MSDDNNDGLAARVLPAAAIHHASRSPGAKVPRLFGAALRLMAGAAAGVLITCLGIAMLQDNLLYYPDRVSLPEMLSGSLSPWPTAQDFRGLVAEPAGPARATAVVFHGNAGHAGHRQFYAGVLTRLGLRVILAEYPGYGPRGGELGETSLVTDAEQTIAAVHARYGEPMLIVGESLGAGVAAAASVRQRAMITGLLLITPWDRLEHVASHHYPLLPVQWLLRDRYDSVTHLAAFDRPVLLVVADNDRIVPARFGRALHAALAEPKRLSVIAGADHNDWFDHLDDAWWQQAIDFLLTGAR